MSKLYYVLGVNFTSLNVWTDLSVDKNEALNLAWKMAQKLTENSPDNFIKNPLATALDDHTVWVFANSPYCYVVVEEREVPVFNDLGTLKSLDWKKLLEVYRLGNSYPAMTEPKDPIVSATPRDNPLEDSLPGSFNNEGKGITIGDIRKDPYNCIIPTDLSEAKMFGLVKARISKRPLFGLMLDQKAALAELKVKSNIAYDIVHAECDDIANFIYSLREDDSSSESSEEE